MSRIQISMELYNRFIKETNGNAGGILIGCRFRTNISKN